MNLIKVSASNFNKYALKSVLGSRALHISPPLPADKSYYEILRVPPNASQTEIKEAYYKLSKVYHPDIAKDENSLKMFRSITEAYDTLGNVRSRIQYDNDTGIQSVHEEMNFHPTGYKEMSELRAVAPDYDKILARKTLQDEWEDFQYKERRTEVQQSKSKFYVEDENFLWTPVEKRLMRIGILMFALMFVHKWWDETYYEKIFDPNSKK